MFLASLVSFLLPLVPELDSLQRNDTATLLFAGDAMMHQAQIDASRTPGGHDFSECFAEVKPMIEAADFAVVNLEAPLGGKPYSGYPCFSAPDEYPRALSDAGFDLFLLANNHILDRRDRGLHRTILHLDSLQIPHIGAYHDPAARDSIVPKILTVKGFKVGFLNYTYGTNGIKLQGPAIVDYIDTAQIRRDILKTRTVGAELIAVCIHWGDEYRLQPNAAQKSLAEKLISMGADMVLGGHPHVVQPLEIRRNGSGRRVVVAYSLGNFISNMKTTDTRGGAVVQVILQRDSAGRAEVAGADFSLVFTEPGTFRLVAPSVCTDPRAKAFEKNALKTLTSDIK